MDTLHITAQDPGSACAHTAADTLTTPEVPGYELSGLIGRGGMGDVYQGRDLELDREVAVKILQDCFPADSPTAARFLEEAKITGQLQHPGIPAVYRAARLLDGRPFLAMKLIKGQTLDELLKTREAVSHLALMEAVAQAVGYAHAHNVIHRDLKPANVMVGAFGEVQVMDWGLAKVLTTTERGPDRIEADPEATTAQSVIRTARESDYTQAGSVLGTPAYMPPEQASGETARVGKASDVFGLGALWCRMLTGQPPFTGADAESVRRNAMRGRTEEAQARLDACGADPEVVALCKRCLAVEPEDRPQDANAVAAEVAELRVAAEERARHAELAKVRAEVAATEQTVRRRTVLRWAGAVAAVLVLGLAGTGLGLWWADTARREAQSAEQEADAKRIAAEQAEAREAEQRKKAEEETALAKAVKEFLQEVLLSANPGGAFGQGFNADVRLRDVVMRAANRIEGKFQDRPLVEAELRHSLGSALNRPELKLKQFERAVAIRRELLGPDHPDTLRSLGGLIGAYGGLGRHADAFKLTEESFALHKARFGPEHPETLRAMSSMATAYRSAQRYQDALNLYEETITIQKAKLGPHDPSTLGSMAGLASTYTALGRHADALKLNEETLALRKAKLGHNHPSTLLSMFTVAESYATAGRQDDALKLFEETHLLMKVKLGFDHDWMRMNMDGLVRTYRAMGRHADALKVCEESVAALKTRLGPEHPTTLDTEWRAIVCLMDLKKPADTLPRIDALIAMVDKSRAAGLAPDIKLVPALISDRLKIHRDAGNAAGCRETAEILEKSGLKTPGGFYDAARYRAVAAALEAKKEGAEEARLAKDDADRAMEWLRKAVAAGYTNRNRLVKDMDLEILRGRDDFKKLLAGLPPAKAPPAK